MSDVLPAGMAGQVPVGPRLQGHGVSITLEGRALVRDLHFELGQNDRLLVTADRGESLAALAYALAGLAPSPWRRAVETSPWSREWVQFEHRVLASCLECEVLQVPRRTLLLPEDLDTWFMAGTGSDELAFFGWTRGGDPSLDERLFDLFDPALLARPIYNLSGGEKQRLALAVALVAHPDCVVVLNGLGWLDRDHRPPAVETLRSLGVPLVFCDDHVELLAGVCTRHLHIDADGRVEPGGGVGPSVVRRQRTAPGAGKPLVRAARLTFVHPGFDDVRVLDETTFEIPAVENVFVVGANGTGKSTLANLVCGLERRYSGELLVRSDATAEMSPRALRDRLGVSAPQLLFQFVDDNLVRSTVGDYLALGLAGPALAARADVLSWLEGLDAGTGRLTTELDTLQKKAVVLARMAITGCRVVFLDEPAWGLTRAERSRLHDGIDRLLAGITKFWITHEPEAVPYDPQAVVRIVAGKVALEAST